MQLIVEMMIHDPRLSLCGRFEVNPICDYGIPDDLADAVRVINKYIDIQFLIVNDELKKET